MMILKKVLEKKFKEKTKGDDFFLHFLKVTFLGLEFDEATDSLELLLGELGDVAGADDAGGGDDAVAEELGLAVGEEVDDGEIAALLEGGDVGDQLGELVEVDGGLPGGVGLLVVVAHAALAEVSGVILVEVDSVVVRATGVTATGRVLLMLTDTAITVELRTAHAASLAEAGGHCCVEGKKGFLLNCFIGCQKQELEKQKSLDLKMFFFFAGKK